MATNAIPDTPSTDGTSAARSTSATGRWLLRVLFGLGLLVAVGAGALYWFTSQAAVASGPKLTYTISRSDLFVTVTEQGTLESANNTEIKCKVRGRSTVNWVIEGGTEVQAGDELVRLDTKQIEDAISLATTNVHTARADLEESKANVATAEIAISSYLEGEYVTQMKNLQRGLATAKWNLETAEKMLDQSKKLFREGYVSELEVEGQAFTVTQAELELDVAQTAIDVLDRYTKEMQLETRRGNLTANRSKLEADEAGLAMDEARLARAERELEACVVTAERSGLVIYPSAAAWKNTPDITEGASVVKDQVLLLMPDLTQMQVKVGIHESMVDHVKPKMRARVTLPGRTLDGEVESVAAVTRPAGWWTGNVVKYDTIIKLPSVEGLKPGMSAEVEVIMQEHHDVLTIPVAAVVETEEGEFCWVKNEDTPVRRAIKLGDTDDAFIVVEAGLREGDQVVLNPLELIDEAQSDALKPLDETTQSLLERNAAEGDQQRGLQ